jgi:hypothetical protein
MSIEDDRGYFARRADQERALAACTKDRAAQMVHHDLAVRYEALSRESAPQMQQHRAA